MPINQISLNQSTPPPHTPPRTSKTLKLRYSIYSTRTPSLPSIENRVVTWKNILHPIAITTRHNHTYPTQSNPSQPNQSTQSNQWLSAASQQQRGRPPFRITITSNSSAAQRPRQRLVFFFFFFPHKGEHSLELNSIKLMIRKWFVRSFLSCLF